MNHMIYRHMNGMTWLEFPHLSEYRDIRHGIFTRLGGFSLYPYQGLNVSGSNGDNPELVQQNRHLIFQQMGQAEMIFTQQCHGVTVFVTTEDR